MYGTKTPRFTVLIYLATHHTRAYSFKESSMSSMNMSTQKYLQAHLISAKSVSESLHSPNDKLVK